MQMDIHPFNALAASVDYAATFWVQHLNHAKQTTFLRDSLAEHGEAAVSLCSRLLEWLECLSLLNKLPFPFEALEKLVNTAEVSKICV